MWEKTKDTAANMASSLGENKERGKYETKDLGDKVSSGYKQGETKGKMENIGETIKDAFK